MIMAVKDKKDIKNRNASPSAYGWAFQVGAGIKLMLEYVKEFTALKMEGKDDDIEITLPDGKIYAQAKSVTVMGNQSTAMENLKNSLDTLSDDVKKDSNPVKLIYITNILNPLSTSSKISPHYEKYGRTYDYSTLPDDDRKKIKNIVGDDFPVEILQIHVIEFFGEGKNKFEGIKENIRAFVRDALDDPSLSDNLFDKWYTLFSLNCTDKPKEDMSFDKNKKEIMYPVIVLAIDPPISSDDFREVSDYDDYGAIVSKYRDMLNQRACEYDFSSSLLAEYQMQKYQKVEGERSRFKFIFVKENWKQYEDSFNQIDSESIREAVTKMTILTIIERAYKLEKIRKAANL
jgi:hypothetical protein